MIKIRSQSSSIVRPPSAVAASHSRLEKEVQSLRKQVEESVRKPATQDNVLQRSATKLNRNPGGANLLAAQRFKATVER